MQTSSASMKPSLLQFVLLVVNVLSYSSVLSISLSSFYVSHPAANLSVYDDTSTDSNSEESAFQKFREDFSRSYEPGSAEFSIRFKTFKKSIGRHVYLNSFSRSSSNNSAKYGVTEFSDLSPDEFRERYLGGRHVQLPKYTKLKEDTLNIPLAPKFDWREKNVVTPVQSQQSTQEKIVKTSEYPFKALTGVCHFFPKSAFGVSIKGYEAYDFSGQEEKMMEKLVQWGPLVVTVDAVSWQDYLGGVIQHHCSSQEANHAVLITGFDRTGEVPYWIVRNSWGTSWGNEGYVYIEIGGNICGIADSVSAAFV
ncbi:cathepsin O isoform X2 [Polyodon spathula]|uniref:cathepsin O isoform X2 n=1 Tax=Polyodon spathula TaxID=7913 RepID=UPI001B7EFE64|nr:cathepsin O isoform X2 [Polyodon spathula]